MTAPYRGAGGYLFALDQVRAAMNELRVAVADGVVPATLTSVLARVANARAYLVDAERALEDARGRPAGGGAWRPEAPMKRMELVRTILDRIEAVRVRLSVDHARHAEYVRAHDAFEGDATRPFSRWSRDGHDVHMLRLLCEAMTAATLLKREYEDDERTERVVADFEAGLDDMAKCASGPGHCGNDADMRCTHCNLLFCYACAGEHEESLS